MASTLTLDTSEPDTKSLVDGWKDSTEYTLTVVIRTGTGDARNACTVLEVIEESESIPEEEAETEAEVEEAPAYAPKAAAPAPVK